MGFVPATDLRKQAVRQMQLTQPTTREQELEFCLRQIVSMLPALNSDKQWLDPSIEDMARKLLGVDRRNNPLPDTQLQAAGRVKREITL
jgi:hypothetical protein